MVKLAESFLAGNPVTGTGGERFQVVVHLDQGCAFPGCTHTRFLHAHHVEHWLHGGETSIGNCVLIRSFHYHLVHEGGWTITVSPDGAFVFHSPAGNPLVAVSPREHVGNILTWPHEWAEENDLNIGPDTNYPQGDGKTPD